MECHEVDTDVEGGRFLPGQVGVGIERRSITVDPLSVHKVGTIVAIGGKRLVGTEVRTSRHTIGDTWLEALEDVAHALGKWSAGDFPGHRSRWEVTPLGVGTELGAAFTTHRSREEEHVVVVVVQASEEADQGRFRGTCPKACLAVLQCGTVADAVPAHRVIDEVLVLVAALFPVAALPRIAEHELDLVLIEVEGVVGKPFQAVGPPLLVVDPGTSVIAVPERFARSGGCIEVALLVVVLQCIAERGVQHVTLGLKDVELHVGIAQKVNAVAFVDVLPQVVHRVMDICRRIGLIVGSVGVLDGNGGVHRKGGVKQAVVAPILVYPAAREGCIELQAVVEHALLAYETCTIFLASADDVKTVALLVVERNAEEAVLGRAVNRKILVEVVACCTGDLVPPVGVATVVLATARTTELLGSEDARLRLGNVEGYIAVVGHVGDACCARTLLGRYEDDAVGTTGAVDGCRTGILQYGDRLDVLGGDVAEVTACDAVNHDEWAVGGCQRTCTTHLDFSGGIRVGFGSCCNVKTCHLAGNQRHRVAGCTLVEVLLRDLNHRARDLLLGHRTVAHYDYFVQLGNVFAQCNGHTVLGRNFLGVETDVADHKGAALVALQLEVTVEVCHCSVGCSFHQDTCANDGLACVVNNHAIDGGLCRNIQGKKHDRQH